MDFGHADSGMPVDHQAPYALDMVPCDFWTILKSKISLKGNDSNEENTLCVMRRQIDNNMFILNFKISQNNKI